MLRKTAPISMDEHRCVRYLSAHRTPNVIQRKVTRYKGDVSLRRCPAVKWAVRLQAARWRFAPGRPFLPFQPRQDGAAQPNPSSFWTNFGNPLAAHTALPLGQRRSAVRTIILPGGKHLSSHCGPPSFCIRSLATSICTPDVGMSVRVFGHGAIKAFNSGGAAYSGCPPNAE